MITVFPVRLGSCLIWTLDGGTDTPLPDGISECETDLQAVPDESTSRAR